MPKTIFISDLHLAEHRPELTKLFINFIDYCLELSESKQLDNLYILGDFFNYWIGNDSLESWHNDIIVALEKLSKYSKIYFLVGNRDFQVNQQTAALFHFELIKQDIKKINLYGQDVLILHGDTLCTNDKSYQRFRKIVRANWVKKFYLNLPLALRIKIAKGLKKQSNKNYQANIKTPEIFDVTENAVLDLFKTQNTSVMIHGHTHKPKKHKYANNNKNLTRYVLGDWHNDGAYYLEVSDNSNEPHLNRNGFELKFFS